MPATQRAFGFRPIYHPSGTIRANMYQPGARAAAAAIYRGDPVKLVEDGTDFVTIAAATDAIIGVFAGCEYTDVNGKPTEQSYWPGSVTGATNIVFYVYDDPNIIFEASFVAAISSSCVGKTASSVIVAGSTQTGLTGSYMSALKAAGTTGQWRVVGIGKYVDNAVTDTSPIVEVMIGQHQYQASVVGI